MDQSRSAGANLRMQRMLSLRCAEATEKTYENLLCILDSRRRAARPRHVANSQDTQVNGGAPTETPLDRPEGSDWKGTPSIVGMKEWLQVLGHSSSDLDALNTIHVAGTKGKGSTCAFTECILRHHGKRTGFPKKIGLYTSPHLRTLEERIRINFEPISQSELVKYFYEVHDKLFAEMSQQQHGVPKYLQLMALVAFHTFVREKVDVAIFETHHGGEFDATNVIERPSVTAITTLGLDHVKQLGPTLENIAWHKSGIFKQGATALSTHQLPGAAQVLRNRAQDKQAQLRFVGIDDILRLDASALRPKVQKYNASLAIAIAQEVIRKSEGKSEEADVQLTAEDVAAGVDNFSWPGRFQTLADGDTKWFLDSAHNEISVKEASQWFIDMSCTMLDAAQPLSQQDQSNTEIPPERILIFSQISEEREGVEVVKELARCMQNSLGRVKHVIFSSYNLSKAGQEHEQANVRHQQSFLEQKDSYDRAWREIDSHTTIWHEYFVDKALKLAQSLHTDSPSRHVLVTGSQHLVGSALSVLESEK